MEENENKKISLVNNLLNEKILLRFQQLIFKKKKSLKKLIYSQKFILRKKI